MRYQADYGAGWITIDPVDPSGNPVDPEDFFDHLEEEGSAVRARVLSGRQVIAETSFEEEEEEEEEEEDDEEDDDEDDEEE